MPRRTAAIFADLPIIENTFYSLTEGHRELEPTEAVTILEEPQPSTDFTITSPVP